MESNENNNTITAVDTTGADFIVFGDKYIMLKPVKYFEQLKVEDLKQALNHILSQQFLQVKIERYERNFIWHRLMNELAKVSSVVER